MADYEEDVVLEKYWPEEAAHEGKAAGSTVPLSHHFEGPKHNFPGLEMKMGATGVIWTTDRAAEKGFSHDNPEWANLGQGAPEVGPIPGCFKRPDVIDASESSREYASTAGVKELREAVANLYNHDYREGKESKYTYENVCIVPGGRAGLIRIAAILSDVYLSFFFPDYTAYSEMLALFKNFSPIPVPLKADDDYQVHLDIIRAELDRGVSALLTSNPRNPTGQAMRDQDLKDLQDMCRKRCLLIMDEFYTRYNYEDGCNGSSVSSAANIIDVNEDPVLIVDGLTKSFRLPGWRICWIVGPKAYIKALASAGSFLDGGSNAPFQKAAVPFLEPSLVKKEMTALQVHFKAKRDYCIDRLEKMGFKFHQVPTTTFYIWLDLSPLPKEINSSLHFFEACLDEKVIMVPGIFFDLNPLARREIHHSPYYHFMRLSYGPPMENLVKGMDAIERVINKYKK